MSTKRASLETTPHDVLLRIVALLDIPTVKSLSLCHPLLVEACRTRIHRTIDTFAASNTALERLTCENVLSVVASNVRRLRASYNWRHLEKRNHLPSAAEIDVFLLQRDELLAKLLRASPNIKVLTIILFFEYPYATSYVHSQLDRLTLIRFADALAAQQESLWTVKIDFAMPLIVSNRDHALAFPLLLMQRLSHCSFANVQHLSIANLTLHVNGVEGRADGGSYTILARWLRSFANLRYLQWDNAVCDEADLVDILPERLEGLELIDTGRRYNSLSLLAWLQASRVELRHLRIVTLSRCWEIPTPVEHHARTTGGLISLGGITTLILENASRGKPADSVLASHINEAFRFLSAPKLERLIIPNDHRACPAS